MSSIVFGAEPHAEGGFRFSVWAPKRQRVDVRLLREGRPPLTLPLGRDDRGLHSGVVGDAEAGDRYLLRLDQRLERPDPASRAQPGGVHGPSMLVDPRHEWTDHGWAGRPLHELVIYELHVGTFTPTGTFDAAIEHLDDLVDLGITAVELLPIAQFPGHRNWGYDGVYPYAAQWSYGGLPGLQRFVDACHARDLCVLLDVVYNHLGPEGCYLGDFGPFFTDTYRTPWGAALNFDGPDSQPVRRFFVENALWWVDAAHIDGFRLDAVHAIVDSSAYPLVEELTDAVHARGTEQGRELVVIAEDAANDGRLTRSRSEGGMDLDAQWNDDLHHALHVALTGERQGYYNDFTGITEVAEVLDRGFAYNGRQSPSRRSVVGRPEGVDPARTVGFLQNHDQIGNRAIGERIGHLVGAEAQVAAAGLVLLGPWIPLVFQGEEHLEEAPFQYFVDHSDAELIEAVRRGRAKEFRAFGWDDVPDPADPSTFERSTLDHALAAKDGHAQVRRFYRDALELRRRWRERFGVDVRPLDVRRHDQALVVTMFDRGVTLVANLGGAAHVPVDLSGATWRVALDSTRPELGGAGGPAPDTEGSTTLHLTGPAFVAYEQIEA